MSEALVGDEFMAVDEEADAVADADAGADVEDRSRELECWSMCCSLNRFNGSWAC